MGPAGTAFEPWQAVVPLITVGFQIPAVVVQEFLCLTAAHGRGIAYRMSTGSPSSPLRNNHINDWDWVYVLPHSALGLLSHLPS